MMRHMVLFRFRPEASEQDRRAVLDGLAQLPMHFPQMRRFGLGENVSQRDRTFSHVMAVEFERREEMESYLNSAEHEEFVSMLFRPAVEGRAIASFDWPGPGADAD